MQAQRADVALVCDTKREADPVEEAQCVQSGVAHACMRARARTHLISPLRLLHSLSHKFVPDTNESLSPGAVAAAGCCGSCFVSRLALHLSHPYSHGLRCVAPLESAAGGTEGTDVCLNKFAVQVYKTGGGQNCLDLRWLAGDVPTFLELGAQIISRMQPTQTVVA
jgi:hypothetical protein